MAIHLETQIIHTTCNVLKIKSNMFITLLLLLPPKRPNDNGISTSFDLQLIRLQNNVNPCEQIGLVKQLGSLPLWITNIPCPPHVALICNCCSNFFYVGYFNYTCFNNS
jgi:hypothetical protein